MPWCLVVRSEGEAASIASLVQEELRRIDAAIPVHRINTVAEQVDDALAQERMIAALCGFFGIVAVVLAAVGLDGVLAYTVTRRTKEIGIRMAIGSQPSALIGMMLWESLSLVAAGIGIGLPAGIVAARLIESQLFGVTAADALTAVATAGLMIAVALLAGWIPARRAARIDPMTALRCD
jgi:ABC-type antimicrobial peptide transport system permease subunit